MTISRRSLFGLALVPLATDSSVASPTEFNRACRLANGAGKTSFAAKRVRNVVASYAEPSGWMTVELPIPEFQKMASELVWMANHVARRLKGEP